MDFETHDRSIIEDLGEEIAALKAENERLAKERQDSAREWRIAFDNMQQRAIAAERALAERAGGVKVLDWRGSESVWHKADAEFGEYYRITEYSGMQKPFKLETHGWWSGSPSGYYELLDAAKAAAQADYERRIRSALTTEPAAPEGQQEPVAWWVHDLHIARQPVKAKSRFPEATEYLYPASREEHAREAARTLGAACTPLYTRPSEQAVTEAMVEAAVSAFVKTSNAIEGGTVQEEQDRQQGAALPPYGKMPFDELGRDVSEAGIGVRRDFDFGETYPGHVMTGINFNSLNRIVSKYATPRPAEQAVTEAMVEAAYEKVRRMPASVDTADGDLDAIIRAALKAAMEATRHG